MLWLALYRSLQLSQLETLLFIVSFTLFVPFSLPINSCHWCRRCNGLKRHNLNVLHSIRSPFLSLSFLISHLKKGNVLRHTFHLNRPCSNCFLPFLFLIFSRLYVCPLVVITPVLPWLRFANIFNSMFSSWSLHFYLGFVMLYFAFFFSLSVVVQLKPT